MRPFLLGFMLHCCCVLVYSFYGWWLFFSRYSLVMLGRMQRCMLPSWWRWFCCSAVAKLTMWVKSSLRAGAHWWYSTMIMTIYSSCLVGTGTWWWVILPGIARYILKQADGAGADLLNNRFALNGMFVSQVCTDKPVEVSFLAAGFHNC